MFFKHALQTVTHVKIKDTLRDELMDIEKRKNGTFFKSRLSSDEYELYRNLTINAYRTTIEVKKAQTIARNLNTEQAWSQAYLYGEKADMAMGKLLSYKLGDFLYPFVSLLTCLEWIAIMSPLLYRAHKKNYIDCKMDCFFIALALLPISADLFLLLLGLFKEQLETILIESQWKSLLLTEARIAGITINTNQTQLLENQPWSNAQLLADINVIDFPDEFICNISLEIMTKPVSCTQNPALYDEDVITKWLCVKSMHPITHKPLYWDDLIPNTAMEDKINRFTHEKTKEYIKESTLQNLFEQIEMDAEDQLSHRYSH